MKMLGKGFVFALIMAVSAPWLWLVARLVLNTNAIRLYNDYSLWVASLLR